MSKLIPVVLWAAAVFTSGALTMYITGESGRAGVAMLVVAVFLPPGALLSVALAGALLRWIGINIK